MTNEERENRVQWLLDECERTSHTQKMQDGRCACQIFKDQAMFWNDETIEMVVVPV